MFDWLSSKKKPVDAAAESVLTAKEYLNASRRGNVVDLPVTVAGLPNAAWLSVDIPQDYPATCPKLTFMSRSLRLEHPVVGPGGVLVAHQVRQWHERSQQLKDLVDAVVFDLQVRPPAVWHEGEAAVVVQKGVGEPLGCVWDGCVLQQVSQNARWASALQGYVGRECVRVNNIPTGGTRDSVLAADGMSYVVLNFKVAGAPPVQPPHRERAEPTAPQEQPKPWQPPPLPAMQSLGDCGLELAATHDPALLERLSDNPTEQREYFTALPFNQQCETVVKAAQAHVAEVQERHDGALEALRDAQKATDDARREKDAVATEHAAVMAEKKALEEQLSPTRILQLLGEYQKEQQQLADDLERSLVNAPEQSVDTDDWKLYKAARYEYYLAKAKRPMVTQS
eukprot:TRINITY_DN1366_c0_g1_i1.p1 TRINITY_DN1366_c0_g1~~TRINITY_DN1366_c0_g1_i1.p1  ORF type:complete len:396 (+),score=125.29 TRINITY_DN1366_c0_g1_i1:69-1256(+)